MTKTKTILGLVTLLALTMSAVFRFDSTKTNAQAVTGPLGSTTNGLVLFLDATGKKIYCATNASYDGTNLFINGIVVTNSLTVISNVFLNSTTITNLTVISNAFFTTVKINGKNAA